MDSVMVSHDPPSGVYSGRMPCSNNQTTQRGVRCPARLSMINSRAQWWPLVAQGWFDAQADLPMLPRRTVVVFGQHLGSRQRLQDDQQLGLQPSVEHNVGAW